MSNKRKFPQRNWGLFGFAEAGKSTFIAHNAAVPLYAIDPDNRFDAVEELVAGKVIYPKTAAGHMEPLAILQQAEEAVYNQGVKAISVDSVTKIYSRYARPASIANRMSPQQREKYGYGKNNASNLVEKSDAMTILTDLAALRTEIYYVWHQRSGVDAKGKAEVRAAISGTEMNTLSTSIGVHLEFLVVDGKYGVKVVKARDYGGRPANVGFTMWDSPRNYWKGAAERLEHLIYTAFDAQAEAIAWAVQQGWAESAAQDVLARLSRQQLTPQQVWAGFVDTIAFPTAEKPAPVQAKVAAAPKAAPAPVAVAQPEAPPPPEEPTYDPDEEFNRLMGPPNEPEPPAGNSQHKYGNNTPVAKADVADYETYKAKFKRAPWEFQQLDNARKHPAWQQ